MKGAPMRNPNQTPLIWKPHTPNKVKFFLWLLHHNKLPTKFLFNHKVLQINPNSHLVAENIHRIFFECLNIHDFSVDMLSKTSPNNILSIPNFHPNC